MLKSILLVTLLTIIPACVLACHGSMRIPHTEKFALNNVINSQTFIDEITEGFGNRVMGYTVVLRGPTGNIVASVEHGWAQSPCEAEGGRRYSIDTVTGWASSSKVISAAAVLNIVEQRDNRSLNERLVDLLPEAWPVGPCSGPARTCWSAATIAHTLSHRAGFKKNGGSGWETRLSRGTSEVRIGTRKYANASFSVFEYLGHFIAPQKMQEFEDQFSGDPEDYTSAARAVSRTHWDQHLQSNIFSQASIKAFCGDVNFDGPNFALVYDHPQDHGDGFQITAARTSGCTAGGMVMSASSMSKVLHTLAHTDRILSPAFFQDTMTARSDNRRMGFDIHHNLCVRARALDLSTRGCDNRFALSKNGGSRGGRLGTELFVFSDGFTLAFARNSKTADASNVDQRRILIEAYLKAAFRNAGDWTSNR